MSTRVLPGSKLSEERVEREAGGASSQQASLPSPQGQLSTGRLASASGIFHWGSSLRQSSSVEIARPTQMKSRGRCESGTLGVRLGIDAAGALQLGNRSRWEDRGCCFTEPGPRFGIQARRPCSAVLRSVTSRRRPTVECGVDFSVRTEEPRREAVARA